ncbi:MAG: hypothetical protein FWE87_01065 [Coriobacteriia bacterium]|nr:hypothetical protein [Coriobacteriia bacterium]
MKRLKKAFLVLLIVVVSLVALLYSVVFLGHKVLFPVPTSDVPTIEAATDSILTLGVQAHSPQPTTVDEYLNVLAGQIKNYNEIAPELWADNPLTNQSIVVEEITKNDFWLIEPNGTFRSITKEDALKLGIDRVPYFTGFSQFDGGVYLAISSDDVTNYLLFEKYLHLGTYDPFITFSHEAFHIKVQDNWMQKDNVSNSARDEFFEDTAARAKRDLLQRQILKAVREPANTESILDALATYEDYKVQFPKDYENSLYTDRIEGTAYYYELISSLHSAYPDQMKNVDDLQRALALLATREDIYLVHGLVTEGYNLGGFTGVLLDRHVDDWQTQFMNDPDMTPLELLYQHFSDEALPGPVQLTQADIDAVGTEIEKNNEDGGPHNLFQFLYDILF